MSIIVKVGDVSWRMFKVFLLSFMFSLFLIGCGGGDEEDVGNPTGSTITHKVSFLDGDLNVVGSANKSAGNVNISAIADELGITYSIYAANSVVVRNNFTYEEYNLTRDVSFYTVTGVQEISNQNGLDAIRTNLSGTYILTADINLDPAGAGFTAAGWDKIGAGTTAATRFSGKLSGNGHTISGLWINIESGTTNYVGLFSYITNAQIKNLNIEIPDGKEIKGNNNYVGAVAGYVTDSAISNVYVRGAVKTPDDYVGGIVGYAGASTVTNSCFVGSVNGDQYIGGVAGYIDSASIIKNSCFEGSVIGTNTYVGGIVGYVTGTGSTVKNSYSSGAVNGNGNTGGIVGRLYTGSLVLNSYSDANVSSTAAGVGGIAGYVYNTASITNSYSQGVISGTTYVGGIAGEVYYGDPVIQNNAAINPSVIGSGTTYKNRVTTAYANGGYLDATSNNFALSTMSGTFTQNTNTANHGISKTVAELTTNTTYITGLGWAFGNDDDNPWVWGVHSSYPYPTLYWE
ncbi:MAG: hypothetical protein LBS39_01945 [Campylobacteraceae bacterium]|jgi:hypothetical protein|nr:hypothetical protein [Campylobacteraceae bacterium]